jgi:hypothetical protein
MIFALLLVNAVCYNFLMHVIGHIALRGWLFVCVFGFLHSRGWVGGGGGGGWWRAGAWYWLLGRRRGLTGI